MPCASSPRNKGVTLIELLISLALVGGFLGALLMISGNLLDSRARTRSQTLLVGDLRFAMERVRERTAAATDVAAPASGGANQLELTMTNPSEQPTVISLVNGRLQIQEGTNPAVPLTSNAVEITSFTITRLTATPPAVHVALEGRLRSASGPYQTTLTITDTLVIRR